MYCPHLSGYFGVFLVGILGGRWLDRRLLVDPDVVQLGHDFFVLVVVLRVLGHVVVRGDALVVAEARGFFEGRALEARVGREDGRRVQGVVGRFAGTLAREAGDPFERGVLGRKVGREKGNF